MGHSVRFNKVCRHHYYNNFQTKQLLVHCYISNRSASVGLL